MENNNVWNHQPAVHLQGSFTMDCWREAALPRWVHGLDKVPVPVPTSSGRDEPQLGMVHGIGFNSSIS